MKTPICRYCNCKEHDSNPTRKDDHDPNCPTLSEEPLQAMLDWDKGNSVALKNRHIPIHRLMHKPFYFKAGYEAVQKNQLVAANT